MGDVTHLGGITKLDIPPERVIAARPAVAFGTRQTSADGVFGLTSLTFGVPMARFELAQSRYRN